MKASREFATVVFLGLMLACHRRPPAEQMLHDYWSVDTCMDRAAQVLDPDVVTPLMEREYKTANCKEAPGDISAKPCERVKVGEYCEGFVGKRSYCVKRVAEQEFKLDWLCSKGFNGTPLEVISKSPRQGEMFIQRVQVSLSSSYFLKAPFDDATATLALQLSDVSNVLAYAYAPRASAAGMKLETLLADGKQHNLTLVLSQWTSENPDQFYVMHVATDSWRSLSKQETEEAKAAAALAADHLVRPGRSEAALALSCVNALQPLFERDKQKYMATWLVATSAPKRLVSDPQAPAAYRELLETLGHLSAKAGATLPRECVAGPAG